jgi:hypothetical protein
MTTRRRFLGLFLAAHAMRVAKAAPPPATRTYVLNDCFVAGFRYHEGPGVIEHLRVGEPLTVVAEPTNLYDPRAVRVQHLGRHLGFLPRNQNRAASELLRQGAPLECVVAGVNEQARPWEAVRVRVVVRTG